MSSFLTQHEKITDLSLMSTKLIVYGLVFVDVSDFPRQAGERQVSPEILDGW